MALSLYDASVPALKLALTNLDAILGKAIAHAETLKVDSQVVAGQRLIMDMFPLAKQVQIACDMAKGCVARLAGQEPPKYEDNETTFAELIARVEKTIAFIKTFKPAQIDGTEEKIGRAHV